MTAPKMSFINLPVADLARTVNFYTALGFKFNPAFTDETATCMIINDNTFAMLLTYPKFDSFLKKPRPDSMATTGLLIALLLDSRADVDAMVQKAVAAGGSVYRPATDMGFMYNCAFSDPDGHTWEPFWMDAAAVPPQA